MAKAKKSNRNWIPPRAGPLAMLTVGVDGVVELRELAEPNAPPINAPDSPELHNFAKCLLVGIQAFDRALAEAYFLVNHSALAPSLLEGRKPTISAYEAPGQKYRVRRAKHRSSA
jgi:hypothetical protein